MQVALHSLSPQLSVCLLPPRLVLVIPTQEGSMHRFEMVFARAYTSNRRFLLPLQTVDCLQRCRIVLVIPRHEGSMHPTGNDYQLLYANLHLFLVRSTDGSFLAMTSKRRCLHTLSGYRGACSGIASHLSSRGRRDLWVLL